MRCFALVLLVACSSPPKAVAPSPANADTTPAKPVIDVDALTVRFGGHPIARLHPDGRTESVGNNAPGPNAVFAPGPTLRPDGTILLTKGGYTGRVEANGDIYVVPPPNAGQTEQRFGRVTADGLQTTSTPTEGVRLEGNKLVMYKNDRPMIDIGEFDPPRLGRTALILTAAFYMELAITPQER